MNPGPQDIEWCVEVLDLGEHGRDVYIVGNLLSVGLDVFVVYLVTPEGCRLSLNPDRTDPCPWGQWPEPPAAMLNLARSP